MHALAVGARFLPAVGIPAQPADRQHFQRRHHDTGDENHQRHRIRAVAPQQDHPRHDGGVHLVAQRLGHHDRHQVGRNVQHDGGHQQRQRPLQAVAATYVAVGVAARAAHLIGRQDRRAAGARAHALPHAGAPHRQRAIETRRRFDVLPQPTPVHALEGAHLQQAEQAIRHEAAADADIAVGHQLDEADQHPGEENFHHAPGLELEQHPGHPLFQPQRQTHFGTQQNDRHHAKRRDQLHEHHKQRGHAGVVFRHHDFRNLNQPDFIADAGDAHVDKRENVGQHQHEQGAEGVTDWPLARLVPAGAERGFAARADRFAAIGQRRQRHQHVALRAQHQVILVLRRRCGMTMLLMIVVGTHHIPPK
ncbi:Uncharacterised protein [Serratia marcescens]|nr:Uncharacterised protein [Serratia marcescens]CUZ56609.1 Uncharacterised protein [Serratia marcescens]CUZ57046.1 Uncharacterised protein [Serratia marcescens]CVA20808.1 Uncharacterised protein [Serratia marcescens]CVA86229.1 Uncharacterised protein [Serratia marcescens]